jgi:hypothetical protein
MRRQSNVDERSRRPAGSEHFETVIIVVILDANERIGDAWRKRWDSLRLFTPARYSGLQGWPFPAPAVSFPPRTRWPTISSPTRPDSICLFEPASRWTNSPGRGIGSSLHPASAVSKHNTW